MEKIIIDFINEQECVYIIKTEDMILDSEGYNIGREVIGTSNKGILYDYHYQYGIEKWCDIKDYSLVSLSDDKIICVFDCKTLESTKIDLLIH